MATQIRKAEASRKARTGAPILTCEGCRTHVTKEMAVLVKGKAYCGAECAAAATEAGGK